MFARGRRLHCAISAAERGETGAPLLEKIDIRAEMDKWALRGEASTRVGGLEERESGLTTSKCMRITFQSMNGMTTLAMTRSDWLLFLRCSHPDGAFLSSNDRPDACLLHALAEMIFLRGS